MPDVRDEMEKIIGFSASVVTASGALDLAGRGDGAASLAAALVQVAGLNGGLVAVAKFDLVAWNFGGMDFGQTNVGSRIVYGLVGLAAVYGIGSLLMSGRQSARHHPAHAGVR